MVVTQYLQNKQVKAIWERARKNLRHTGHLYLSLPSSEVDGIALSHSFIMLNVVTERITVYLKCLV